MKQNKIADELHRFLNKAWCLRSEQAADRILNQIQETCSGIYFQRIAQQWSYMKIAPCHRSVKELLLLKYLVEDAINTLK